MNLDDWLSNGWLTKHTTSPEEIENLLSVSDRDLSDCRSEGLSADWKMTIAYNAALQAAAAALAAAGYRATRDSHHYRVIQSLAYTIGADTKLVSKFDQFRKKRNIGGYERAGLVSDQEADEMFELASQLRENIEKWIRDNHPDLL
ncbi:MAG: hypothetical protein DRP65_05500 [Planctomycetota bacterium]|nr:MAG: hypothetical protein DRP65_05500 [Planctomycetota bacterium]